MEDKYLFSFNNIDYTESKLKEELTEEQFERIAEIIKKDEYSLEELVSKLPILDSDNKCTSVLNKKIKELRLENGFTQSDIANILCISQKEYWRMEQEGYNPSYFRVSLLARFYNVSMDWLSGFCEEKKTFGNLPANAKVWFNNYCLQSAKEAKAKGEKIKPNTFDSLA